MNKSKTSEIKTLNENSYYYPLFMKIVELTDVSLLDTDLQDIIDVMLKLEKENNEILS